jgi:hypothetical protein
MSSFYKVWLVVDIYHVDSNEIRLLLTKPSLFAASLRSLCSSLYLCLYNVSLPARVCLTRDCQIFFCFYNLYSNNFPSLSLASCL